MDQKIICNSSPIIALSSIGCMDLLPQLFSQIYIPESVYEEVVIRSKIHQKGQKELVLLIETGQIELYRVKNKEAVEHLYGRLHYGEIEVMIAAKELKVESVALDDLAARKLAQSLLLRPIGTLGLLMLAKQEGIVPHIKPFVDQLMNHGFRIFQTLYQRVLKDEL